MESPSLKRVALLLALTLILVAIGCAPIRYSEYTGHDVSSYLGSWTIGQGTMAETSYAVPVYRGWPEKHYKVLGSLSFPDPNKTWDEGIISAAASTAKVHHADAIIIRQGAEFGVSKIAGARGDPLVISSSYQTTALAIKWLTQEEVAQMDRARDQLLARLAEAHALVQPNATVAQLVQAFVQQSGVDPRSAQGLDRALEVASRLVNNTSDTLAGEWIFKATVSFSTAISGGDDRNIVGLASITQDGENLTIVSSGGGVEMNFAGTFSKNRVSGQLGIGSVSTKCEGAATADKISITFQSLTTDGTVRGNVVLHRLANKPKENEKTKPNSVERRA